LAARPPHIRWYAQKLARTLFKVLCGSLTSNRISEKIRIEAHMFRDLLSCSYKALLTGAQEAGGHVPYDQSGYAAAWELNLMPGLPIGAIGDDLGSGAGCELDGKLRAAHSSAALAVNSFGPWREEASNLRIGRVTGFKTIGFETVCLTGLRGTPPHLDLLADGDSPVAIESKCTEWMTPKESTLSSHTTS
jgi:hypothetical protein